MIPDFNDLAQIYQQRALESLSDEDLAHAKRYRIAAELETVLRECRAELDRLSTCDSGMQYRRISSAISKIDEVLPK